MQRVTWRVRKLNNREWEGWIQIPTLAGLPLGISAKAYSPEAALRRATAVTKTMASAPGLKGLLSPALMAALPPQAKLALMIAKNKQVQKAAKKVGRFFKKIF